QDTLNLRIVLDTLLSVPGIESILDVETLASNRENRLEVRIAGLLGRPRGGVTLHDEQFSVYPIARLTIGQLVGERLGLGPDPLLLRLISLPVLRRGDMMADPHLLDALLENDADLNRIIL